MALIARVRAKNDARGDDDFVRSALWLVNQQEHLSLLFTGNGCERSNLIRLPETVVEHVADYVTLDRDDRATAAAVVEIEQEERRLLAQEGSHKFPFASTTKTTFLNHGGCSGPCVGALALKRIVDEMANRQPMEWHRAVAPALVARAEDTVASYVGCRDPARLHFVENVSVGIFAALQACSLAPAAAPSNDDAPSDGDDEVKEAEPGDRSRGGKGKGKGRGKGRARGRGRPKA